MITYILLAILCVGSWALFVNGFKKEVLWQLATGIIFSVITTAFFIEMSIIWATKTSNAYEIEKERAYYGELIGGLPDDASFETVSIIVSKAKLINRKIELNRKNCDSPLIGFLYSKDVAKLEPIEIPTFKYKNFSEKE